MSISGWRWFVNGEGKAKEERSKKCMVKMGKHAMFRMNTKNEKFLLIYSRNDVGFIVLYLDV